MKIDIRNTESVKFFNNIETVEISRSEMVNMLRNVNNPDMVGFLSVTPEKMNQYLNYWIIDENGKKTKNPNPTPNPFYNDGVYKVSRKYKIVTGFDYEKSINRRLENEGKEGDFKSESPVWFEMISKGLVTDRKTHSKFYFRYQHQNDSTIESEYFFNGDKIEKMMFESFLTQRDYDNQYKNQGLDNTLNFQVVDIENIEYLSMGGIHYHLTD